MDPLGTLNFFDHGTQRNARRIRKQVGRIEGESERQSPGQGLSNSVDPSGMVELGKFHGPRKTERRCRNSRRRRTAKPKSKTEEDDERPKRITSIFRRKVRQRDHA